MHVANTAAVGARDASTLAARLVPACNAGRVPGASVREQRSIAPTASFPMLADTGNDRANTRLVSTIGHSPGSVADRGRGTTGLIEFSQWRDGSVVGG